MYDPAEQTQQPVRLPGAGEAFSDVAVLEPRGLPPVILDQTPGVELDPDLVAASVGVLHVRSVYDLDGTAIADIETLRDPVATAAEDRPARFVRLVKAVSMPDEDLVDLEGTDFGASAAQLMREALGYAMVEPDGSVKVQVPANVAFWVDVLDERGRRITPRHNNWLQVRPGEQYECAGCHTSTSQAPHGRLAAQPPSANPGAPAAGVPFPNASTAYTTELGETMAEARARVDGVPSPVMDLRVTGLWTEPALGAPDPDLEAAYAALATPAPIDPGCIANWQSTCRIVINYEMHIHPLWGADRQQFDEDGNLVRDDTCTSCHSPVDAMGAAMIPVAQLDLGDGASDQEAAHFKSYRELLFDDSEQAVANGAVTDRLVQARDENGDLLFQTDVNGDLILDAGGNPIPVLVPVDTTAPMSVAGALGSPRFFSRFEPGASHDGRLNAAELKLVAEWIDMGGQYYNNPFDVPP
jgi:hypothetical protein